MELVLKKKFHYQALIPAFLTSVIANKIGIIIGNRRINYPELDLGVFDFFIMFKLIILGFLFGLVGLVFNYCLDNSSLVYNKITSNPLIKGFLGGFFTIILFLLLGENYNGLGNSYIAQSFVSKVSILDFIWKILFTAVALGSVFQGGRGNPTFFCWGYLW